MSRLSQVKKNKGEGYPHGFGTSDADFLCDGSFLWGQFIPCDVCVDVLTMLRLHKRFGSNLRHLQHDLQTKEARQQPGQCVESAKGLYSPKELKELRRFLVSSGISVQAVAEVTSQYYGMKRKLSHASFAQSTESNRAMPSWLQLPTASAENMQRGIEGLVWRLQLVLASACMPFGFSNCRDTSVQASFNLGHQPRLHFAYNILCYDTFRERPDLRCGKALAESLSQITSCFPSTSGQVYLGPTSSSTASSADVKELCSASRCPEFNTENDVGELHSEPHPGCVCSFRVFEGCTEVPSLHQGHLNLKSEGTLKANMELNGVRWSQLQLTTEMQLLLQGRCSANFRLKLASALLRKTDPMCFLCDDEKERALRVRGDEWLLLKDSLWTYLTLCNRAHQRLVGEFQCVCSRLDTCGLLVEAPLKGRYIYRSRYSEQPYGGAGPGSYDLQFRRASETSGTGSGSDSDWLGALRALDRFICRVLLQVAETHPTRVLAQTLYEALLNMSANVGRLRDEQRGNWSVDRFNVERAKLARQELITVLTQYALSKSLASCLKPIQFFSLTVRKQKPLLDILFVEGWDFDFRSVCSWENSEPLQRVQEFLAALLSCGCRALLPTDIRGVAEVVREFYSSKQVQARQQQSRCNSKRAKGDGRLSYMREHKGAQVSTASLWASLVEEKVDSLEAVTTERPLTLSKPNLTRVSGGQNGSGTRQLLEAAAEATQVISAYWRRCTILHAQPNARRTQLLIFGDSRRRALLQWLHKATHAITLEATGKKEGKLTGTELEVVCQPIWTSALPLSDKQGDATQLLCGKRSPLKEDGAAAANNGGEEGFSVEEMLLETAEIARAIAGGAIAHLDRLLEFVPKAVQAVNKLVELHQTDIVRVQRYQEALVESSGERNHSWRAVAASTSLERLCQGREESGSKDPKFVKEQQSNSSNLAMKELAVHAPSIKSETASEPRNLCSSSEPNQRSSAHARGGWYPLPNSAQCYRLLGSRNEDCAAHEGPFNSLSYRYLQEFLALNEEGRSRHRLRRQPNTARVCRMAAQSILHSNGPFYPDSRAQNSILFARCFSLLKPVLCEGSTTDQCKVCVLALQARRENFCC